MLTITIDGHNVTVAPGATMCWRRARETFVAADD